MIVLIAAEIESTRDSVREEIEAANRVAAQLLGQLAVCTAQVGGPDLVLQFLQQLGRVRANEVYLLSGAGEVLYHSPPATYKAGREAPAWFARLLAPEPRDRSLPAARRRAAGGRSAVLARRARCVGRDRAPGRHRGRHAGRRQRARLLVGGARSSSPFPVIADGLERLQRGDLAFRLPPLAGSEANAIGAAFNRMAQAVEDKVRAERHAREARGAARGAARDGARSPTSASRRNGA